VVASRCRAAPSGRTAIAGPPAERARRAGVLALDRHGHRASRVGEVRELLSVATTALMPKPSDEPGAAYLEVRDHAVAPPEGPGW
jgi:hypothetical protein